MDKVYDNKKVEEKIYKEWENRNYFAPEVNKKGKPYSIILPPPNANAPLHFGHAMYVIEDILIRYRRMNGDKALWLPGADHAGFETQFVFEKHLQKKGKTRFDYSREKLFEMIWNYVQENRIKMENQLRRLGFSLDWSRKKFTMDKDIVKIVYETFKKLHDKGLLYRKERLVNYCTFDGTSFSDLEVVYEEKETKLYYIKYPLLNKDGYIIVATTRPETMFGDTAIVVNPKDRRYVDYIGEKVKLPLINRKISIISDDLVDQNFGTGAVKVTPAHDPNDFELGEKYNLEKVTVINFDGKLNSNADEFEGLYPKQARQKIIDKLKENGLLEKEMLIKHQAPHCYKCKNIIEPLLMEQWFIKIEPLAKKAIEVVKSKQIKIYPKSFEKRYFQFLENIKDWNISRQIVWGIRIPAWKCNECPEWIVTDGKSPEKCPKCESKNLTQDNDTFDTWFSSSQWPFATLMTTGNKDDFINFYPTTVMETGYDILPWWVARMVMIGLFATQKVPFENIVLHGLVNDPLGKKMSKSKGNVIDPLELVDQYGADAIRFALVYGTALGNNQVLSYSKLQSMRNFTNKLWNIGRFFELQLNNDSFKNKKIPFYKKEINKNLAEEDLRIISQLEDLIKDITIALNSYRIHDASSKLYDFIWHKLADVYIEEIKNRLINGDENALLVLRHVWITCLKLLHPFMPFITEELWKKIPRETNENLIISKWPN